MNHRTVRMEYETGALRFRLESDLSPATSEWLLALLPYECELVHARWSGHAVFARIGALASELPAETVTAEPRAGQGIVYPSSAAARDGEILLSYGPTRLANPTGALAGNHVLTLAGPVEQLQALGRQIHLGGRQKATFVLE